MSCCWKFGLETMNISFPPPLMFFVLLILEFTVIMYLTIACCLVSLYKLSKYNMNWKSWWKIKNNSIGIKHTHHNLMESTYKINGWHTEVPQCNYPSIVWVGVIPGEQLFFHENVWNYIKYQELTHQSEKERTHRTYLKIIGRIDKRTERNKIKIS